MSLITYKYQLFVGEEESVDVDEIELERGAEILHLRNGVFKLNENQFLGTGISRGNLRVYLPGTQPPFAKVGLNAELVIQKDFKSEDGKKWVVFAPDKRTKQGDDTGRPSKRPRGEATNDDNIELRNFVDYVDEAINNKTDGEIYERDIVERKILSWMKPQAGSPKPNCATIWSGRGSGKTSLIRKMALGSDVLKAQRDCGRLMIFDAKRENIGNIVEDYLAVSDAFEIAHFLVALVALHLCKIFGDQCVDGVQFDSQATLGSLWTKKEDLPTTLLTKMNTIRSGHEAYNWWKSCTKGFLKGNEEQGPNPVVIIDTAETLAVTHRRPSPIKAPNPSGTEPAAIQSSPSPPAATVPTATGLVTTPNTPHKHSTQSERRYLVLEWLMMNIPNDHGMIVFGTGQRRNYPEPEDWQTNVNHQRFPPLSALSQVAASNLYKKNKGITDPNKISKDQERDVRMAYAITAGIPRMLVAAFKPSDHVLTSSQYEAWEQHVASLYQDVSILVGEGKLTVPCLAKAIIISAVCDIDLAQGHYMIPNEDMSWNDLRWRSIAFVTGGDENEEQEQPRYFRIPLFLWKGQAKEIERWIRKTCNFDVHDLLPTIRELYTKAGSSSAPSSGVAWEKMFASALVARFFALCWISDCEPETTYIGLDELLPQDIENANAMETLTTVQVCLANGIKASTEEFATKSLRHGLDKSAIYGNWNANISAHHDIVLPVRYTMNPRKFTTFAVSARNGHHKTEKQLIDTKQHCENKSRKTQVAGVIQALNPRHKQGKSTLRKVFKKLEEQKKYAEVVITRGHVHHILGCFD